MKVSGSHVEKIESMSQNVFRINEEQTIRSVTAKLSSEGKHVINIIHGTPSSLMGTVTKTLTFLWESDDEDPRYQQALKTEAIRKREEKLNSPQTRKTLHASYASDANDLSERIHYAELYKNNGTITVKDICNPTPIYFSIFFAAIGMIILLIGLTISVHFLTFAGLFFVAIGAFFVYNYFSDEYNEAKGKREEVITKAKKDSENLDSLKEALKQVKQKVGDYK